MVKFGPVGTIVPDAIFEDITSFLSKDELHQFSLLSPRANRFIKNYRCLKETQVRFFERNGEISISFSDEPLRDTSYLTMENGLMFLKMCRSIDKLALDYFFVVDEKLLKSIMKVKITSNVSFGTTTLNVSLTMFLVFLNRFPTKVSFHQVYLPSEFVFNKTLKLMNGISITCQASSDPHADVTDVFMLERTSSFDLHGFKTGFTVEGISKFQTKTRGYSSFGILASSQLQDAIKFMKRSYSNGITLRSIDGQKTINFFVSFDYEKLLGADFAVDINMEDINSFVPIPFDFIGPVTQQSFKKFDKILRNPEEYYQSDEFKMKKFRWNDKPGFILEYVAKNESHRVVLIYSSLMLEDVIAKIMKNCTHINSLELVDLVLDEHLYHLLKPIAADISVQ